ncbi:hypothetical protein [Cryobacterium cryoconiti]|nr:hypothetical protein [Cryobacterium cryoconiti]
MADTSENTVTHLVSIQRWAALKREFLARQPATSDDVAAERS